MNIVFLTSYYEPEIAASMYLFTNIISEISSDPNNNVTVITPTPTRGVDKEIYSYFRKKENVVEVINDNLKIIRFKQYRESKNIIKRFLRYVLIHVKQYTIAKKVKNIDLIIVTSTPPTLPLVAARLKKRKKCKVLYLLQDLFPESLVNLGISKRKGFLWTIGLKIEKISYSISDSIVGISEEFRNHLISRNIPSAKIHLIPNWVEENKVYRVERAENELFDKLSLDREKFYLSYSGNIGLSQNFDIILETAIKLRENHNICFIVIGEGAYKDELVRKITINSLDNIEVFPFQDYSEIAKVFSLSDVGLILSKEGVGSNSVPSKTWSIMAAEKPILASFDRDSHLSRLIIDNELGFNVSPNDFDGFYQAVLHLYKNKDTIATYGVNGRKYIELNLRKDIGVARYKKVITRMFSEG